VTRAVDQLWLGFGVLGELLSDVAPVVANDSGASLDQLRAVEWMLFEDSLELAGRRLTPRHLLDELVQALSTTALIVEEVDDVWRHTVPAIAHCEEEVEALLLSANGAGAAVPAEHLRQLRAQVSWLRGQAARDPIGVAEAFGRDVRPRVQMVREQLAGELREQRGVAAALERAQAQLAELRDLHARVVEEAGSVWAKIVHPRGLVAPPDGGYLTDPPMGLEPWLARLQLLCRAGTCRPASKGLQRWLQVFEAARAREHEVLAANRVPLERRRELRGLLSSFQAKAAALGLARDDGLTSIAGRAQAILYAVQTDLDEGALLVKEYGDRLRAVNSKEVSYR
jgi:hypothetical protein